MRGLWLEGGRIRLRDDLPVPDPPEGEALVRVLCAGVCNTDLEMIRGYLPFTGIIGHEFVGVVTRGSENLLGRRVVGEINAVCGRCPACLAGRARHCPRRTVLGIADRNGAFAEYLTLPVENLHEVPEGVPTDPAVFTEPLAAALRIREQIAVRREDRVLVVGDGKLGQLIARALALTGCDLLVAGRHSGKLVLLTSIGIPARFTEDVTEGGFDVAVECTGKPEGLAAALRALRPLGTLVMKSTYASPLTVDAARIVVDEISVIGSRCGPFEPAIRLLAERKVDVGPLIGARFPLDEGIAAIEYSRRPEVIKVLIDVAAAR